MEPISVQILHTGGHYPGFVEEYLRSRGAPVESRLVSGEAAQAVDEPEACLPETLGEADVVIAVALPAPLLAALPELLAEKRCQALIIPVEDPAWLRPGPALQLERACQGLGLECAVPVPFCVLSPSGETIAEFCRQYHIGRPRLEVTEGNGLLTEVRCKRGSPCGLTHWVAEELVGTPVGEVEQQVKVLHHARPCLASMALVPETGDTLMHASMHILTAAVGKAVRQARGSGLIGPRP